MNKKLFGSNGTQAVPVANTTNEAGGKAYSMTAEHALAQYIVTGCLNSTFYASEEEQLNTVLGLLEKVAPEFVAKAAVYGRKDGYMKDMPAVMCAYLASADINLLKRIFAKVIDNGKMLRNFVQTMRSGTIKGRKSLGTAPRNLVRSWFEDREGDVIFKQSIGQDPSFGDILRMVHLTPKNKTAEALYGYLIGLDVVSKKTEMKKDKNGHPTTVLFKDLPDLVKQYEEYKKAKAADKDVSGMDVPDVPFQLLDSLNLSKEEWTGIAKNAPWHMARMNLNTFLRHGVFEDRAMISLIAKKLRDPEAIRKVKVFPYQLMAAFLNVSGEMPTEITNALQDAMEIAVQNVPTFENQGEGVFVFPDVSGSMGSPITGHRKGSTTKMRCIDIAGLVSAAVMRNNPLARVIPFEQSVVDISRLRLNPRDSIMTNASKLASIGGGGTNCSAPLAQLVREKAKVSLCIFVSDNESWVDSNGSRYYSGGTGTMTEWAKIKKANPNARLVCIDIQPNGTAQATDRKDILNIGGFSDNVFKVVNEFATGRLNGAFWSDIIKKVDL